MNPEVQQMWTAALRSGDYKQGINGLHIVTPEGGESYCCLGVLCDLAVEAGVSERKRDSNLKGFEVSYEGNFAWLPDSVIEWAGLSMNNPIVNGMDLASLNDQGTEFDHIADLIEEYL